MKSSFNDCSRNFRRGGLTLIEVVVGLLLLSTLLAGLLLSHRRHARQMRLAQQRLAAIQSADRLLADWFATPEGIPIEAAGPVPGIESLWWETSVTDTRLADSLRVQTVRVAIWNGERADKTNPPLVAIELLAPMSVTTEAAGSTSG